MCCPLFCLLSHIVQYLGAKSRKVSEKRGTRLIFGYVAAIEPIFDFSGCRDFLEHMIPPNRGDSPQITFYSIFTHFCVSVVIIFYVTTNMSRTQLRCSVKTNYVIDDVTITSSTTILFHIFVIFSIFGRLFFCTKFTRTNYGTYCRFLKQDASMQHSLH